MKRKLEVGAGSQTFSSYALMVAGAAFAEKDTDETSVRRIE
jgi:hypothetical protein